MRYRTIQFSELRMSIVSAFEFECAKEFLRRSAEPRNREKRIPVVSMDELLARPKHPVLVKGTTFLEYLDPVQDDVSRKFSIADELLSVFSGSRLEDAAFEGLGGKRFRFEEEPYFMANCGANEKDFGLPVLLASNDWASTGWHVDREPRADIMSQLQRGNKL